MQSYVESVLIALVAACVFTMPLVISMRKDRSRYRNIVFLAIAIPFVFALVVAVFQPIASQIVMAFSIVVIVSPIVLPVFLIVNGFQMRKREGKGLANALSLIAGFGIAAGEVAAVAWIVIATVSAADDPNLVSTLMQHVSFGLFLVSVTVLYFSIAFVLFAVYTIFLQVIPHKHDFDYVIVHGAGLKKDGSVTKLLADRCDKAIQIYRKDPTPPYLIASGGQGPDEVQSEAAGMKQYLVEHGIPNDKILMEDASTTTLENVRMSKRIIDARPGKHETALVTSNYHVYRAMRYARQVGLHATGIGAHVAFYYWPSAVLREFAAVHREKKHAIILGAGYVLIMLFLILVRTMS